MNKKPFCAIVGNGRMATHFCRYLEMSGIRYKQWSRQKNCFEDPAVYLNGSRAVFILISDDAIAGFVENHPGLKQMNPIHFSGSLHLEKIPSIHPLMTFSKQLYSLEKYQFIPFIHEKGKVSLRKILPELPNPSSPMDFENKSLYHSLCVLSGNFTTMLWQKVFQDFQDKLGLDRELLLPYMAQTFENLKANWVDALTGPLARKDEDTIQKNIAALEGDLYQNVYRSFADTMEKREAPDC
jgi:2-dehydropantoate 2-reductase